MNQSHTLSAVGELRETTVGIEERITVAHLNGHCLGGGLEIATACDFMIATAPCRCSAGWGSSPPGNAPLRIDWRCIGIARYSGRV